MNTPKIHGGQGCNSDMSGELKDCSTGHTDTFSPVTCSKRSFNSKSVAKTSGSCSTSTSKKDSNLGNDAVGFCHFLEEYTIKVSEVAARYWEKMPDRQRALFYVRSDTGNGSGAKGRDDDEAMFGRSASGTSRRCGESKKSSKKPCAKPMRKSCPKSKKSTKSRYCKPKCPRPKAPKSCPKPRAAKTCPKPRAAKTCPKSRVSKPCPMPKAPKMCKPRSVKKCPKLEPACPTFMQAEDSSPQPMERVD